MFNGMALLSFGLRDGRCRRGVGTTIGPETVALYIGGMKFGKVKRQHGRVGGLDHILDRIVRDCPHVTRIVPGRITRRRGHGGLGLKLQYHTETGLKCLYTGTGTVQEVFVISSAPAEAENWLRKQGILPG
jgi:hypothetical protein